MNEFMCHGQMTMCCNGYLDHVCLRRVNCFKPFLHVFILDKSLLLHVVSMSRCWEEECLKTKLVEGVRRSS